MKIRWFLRSYLEHKKGDVLTCFWRAAKMNQPTFNTCNPSWAHIWYHIYYKIDQHSSSYCKGTSGRLHIIFVGPNNDFCCSKGVTYVALTLCYKLSFFALIFTALHVMQTRSSDENSVCLSVCPSVCLSIRHTRELWQNGRKICPA